MTADLHAKIAKQRNEIARLTQALSRCAHEKLALIQEKRALEQKLREATCGNADP